LKLREGLLDHAIYCTVCNPKYPVTQTPDKISKISSIYFLAFRCGVCVPNLSSLALKLWEEIEVMAGQTGIFIVMKNITPLTSLEENKQSDNYLNCKSKREQQKLTMI